MPLFECAGFRPSIWHGQCASLRGFSFAVLRTQSYLRVPDCKPGEHGVAVHVARRLLWLKPRNFMVEPVILRLRLLTMRFTGRDVWWRAGGQSMTKRRNIRTHCDSGIHIFSLWSRLHVLEGLMLLMPIAAGLRAFTVGFRARDEEWLIFNKRVCIEGSTIKIEELIYVRKRCRSVLQRAVVRILQGVQPVRVKHG
jgi:hypothetical protein